MSKKWYSKKKTNITYTGKKGSRIKQVKRLIVGRGRQCDTIQGYTQIGARALGEKAEFNYIFLCASLIAWNNTNKSLSILLHLKAKVFDPAVHYTIMISKNN